MVMTLNIMHNLHEVIFFFVNAFTSSCMHIMDYVLLSFFFEVVCIYGSLYYIVIYYDTFMLLMSINLFCNNRFATCTYILFNKIVIMVIHHFVLDVNLICVVDVRCFDVLFTNSFDFSYKIYYSCTFMVH